jgi:lambda family phage minor tail protein L
MALSTTAIQEKNKLASTSAWPILLEINIPNTPSNSIVRLVRYDDDITWDGETWVKFPFDIEDLPEDAKGEEPQVTIRISNITRVIESYMQTWDTYVKNNGLSKIMITIYVINTAKLALDSNCLPEKEFIFEYIHSKSNSRWATFTLGVNNLFTKRFPRGIILKNFCRYRFKDNRCNYVGNKTCTTKTLTECRTLNNKVRFGGFPGVGFSGLQVWKMQPSEPKK